MRAWLRRLLCWHRTTLDYPDGTRGYNPYCPKCRTTFIVDAS